MAYIHPQEGVLTVKGYAAARGVTTRTVYEWLTKKPEQMRAVKAEGGWRIPSPVYVPDSPYVGQFITFGDGSIGEVTQIERQGSGITITAKVQPAS